jgi:tryptophan halogenase
MSLYGPVTNVVVLGRDTDLWLCVNSLIRALQPAGVHVTAVELPTRLAPSHVSATLPALEALHNQLGIEEAALLRLTGGSYSLGQNFLGDGVKFFHAWGTHGAPIEEVPFFLCWLRALRHGFKGPLRSFCLTAVAAQNGRMLVPDEATAAFGRTDYGYHLQTWSYVAYLKSLAARRGVECYQATQIELERATDGSIVALLVDGSARIEGQLFVDASGADAVLMHRALQVPRESWRDYFPGRSGQVDRVLTARAPAFTSIPPFAEVRASRNGWTMLHPSRLATGVVHRYCSDLMSDEAALKSAEVVSGARLAEASCQAIEPCVLARVWEGNCVAVGGAACYSDPIHDVGLHVLQLGIVHLLSLLPIGPEFTAERAQYNRVMHSHYQRIRDFQCAYYAFANFRGEFWRRARQVSVSEPLAHKVLTFQACGQVPLMEDETFYMESWQSQLVGLRGVPEAVPPVTDRISLGRLHEELARMLGFIQAKALEQPTHDTYLRNLLEEAVP